MKRTFRSSLLIIIMLFTFLGLTGESGSAFSPPVEISLIDADFTYVGEENGDWAGYFASPAGDVNGDGLADVFIGAALAGDKQCPYPPLPDGTCPPPFVPKGQGVSYLVLGRPESSWPPDPLNLLNADASFLGCDINSMTGRQLYTAGDVNGDGFDDLLVSGWKCGENFTGKAYLFLGRSDVSFWGRWYPVEQADASFLGENEEDFLSYYTATAGDVNADGLDDFLITSTHFDITGSEVITNAGKVYLILGRSDADWGTDFDVGLADASFLGTAEQDRLGRSAAGVGDVNGDGYDDFLIGSISSDSGGWDAGENYLFLGRPAPGDPGYTGSPPWWGADYPVTNADASFLGEEVGEESGRRVAWAGDVNNDGYSDFIIGAARNNFVADWSGIAYLILGRPAADWGMLYSLANADASFVGEEEDDQAGRRLSGAGDINNDGYDDFIIGAPHNERGGMLSGTAYLILGRPAADWGIHFSLANADIIHMGKPDVGVAGYDSAWLGDYNGDNIDDYLIAAYGGRNEDNVPGEIYLMLGSDALETKAITPMPISFSAGVRQAFALDWVGFGVEYWDPNGWTDLADMQLILGEDENDLTGLNVTYDPALNKINLMDSDGSGFVSPCSPGNQIKITNGVVQLDCGKTTVESLDDLRFRVKWAVRWLVSPEVTKIFNAYQRVVDQSANDSQIRLMGTWTLLDRGIFLPIIFH